MRLLLSLFFFILILIATLICQAQETKGARVIKIRDRSGENIIYEESHALIIGASKYKQGWPSLPSVSQDLMEIKGVLKKNGFNVVVYENPNSKDLKNYIEDFIFQHGQNFHNRLLFYFAGHGDTRNLADKRTMGYIIPSDTPLRTQMNTLAFLKKAIDMESFIMYAKRIQSKHAIFLFDSCFSGLIFNNSKSVPIDITKKTNKPVRQFITSGEADEEVSGESYFRIAFIKALEGAADTNGDQYVTGTELGRFIESEVINLSKDSQHPQHGKVNVLNLVESGDFVFEIPSNIASQNSTAIPINIPELLKKIELQWQKLKKEPKINCNDLKIFLENFEKHERLYLDDFPKLNNIKQIEDTIENLTNRLKSCRSPFIDECQCIDK